MTSKDFGDEAETHRDAGRAFCAGSVYFQPIGGVASPISPPQGLPPGVDKASVKVQLDALAAAVNARLDGVELPSAVYARLLHMLTVNPCLSALECDGQLPMLLQNRFVVQARRDPSGGMSLHVLTLGYVGIPLPGGPPAQKAAPYLLIVASGDLLTWPSEPLAFTLTYSRRKAEHTRMDAEMPGALATPPA